MLSKGIQRAQPKFLDAKEDEKRHMREWFHCAMRNSKSLSPKAYVLHLFPLPVTLVSKPYWTAFPSSFSVPNTELFLLVAPKSASLACGKHSEYEQENAEMQLAERSHWRLYALAVRS